MSSSVLKANELSFEYPGERQSAVKDVSFELGGQEIVTLVGSSGSGKSTLLNLIAGHLSPTKGQVHVNGELMIDPKHLLVKGFEDVEIVKQDFQLSPRSTVFKTIKHPLRRYNKDYQEERVAELIALCNLNRLEDKITMDLSGGQKQRVAIARSLADNPSLILMDEPFNQLDHTIKLSLKSELKHILSTSNTSALIVTHDPIDALSISDRIVVMKDGALLSIASPRQHYLQPLNSYVAQLFGPYNIVSAKFLLKHWKLKEDAQYMGFRPEHITIANDGPAVKITGSAYTGQQYLLTAELDELMLYFYHDQDLSLGEFVSLKIQYEQLHPIAVG